MKDFNKYLVEYLNTNGLQQLDFAEKIGYTRAQVSRWVNGRSEPNQRTIAKIVKAYPDFNFQSNELPLKSESGLISELFEELRSQLRQSQAQVNQLLTQQAQLLDLLGKQKGNYTKPNAVVRSIGIVPQLKTA
jgi:transcriptional regulator with XRE-family HTH domain